MLSFQTFCIHGVRLIGWSGVAPGSCAPPSSTCLTDGTIETTRLTLHVWSLSGLLRLHVLHLAAVPKKMRWRVACTHAPPQNLTIVGRHCTHPSRSIYLDPFSENGVVSTDFPLFREIDGILRALLVADIKCSREQN